MRKIFFFAIAILILGSARVTEAEAQKLVRIGYLDLSMRSTSPGPLDAFRHEMTRLGWIEGKNIAVEYRFADQQPKRLPDLAAELVRLNTDLIVCPDTSSALAAKNATTTIPVVMVSVGDAVEAGLVASLARPGGNITGLSSLTPELAGKRLEILKEAVPEISRVGFLWFSGGPGVSARLQLKAIGMAASALNMQLQEIAIKVIPNDLESAFQNATQKQVKAILTASQRVISGERKRIIELVGKYKLPAIHPEKEFVESGGLMSYGTDRMDSYRRAATYVDKILKGTKPADLPVEQPKKFEFIVNLKTAKQIGLTVPPNVLARADRVIK